MSPLALPEPSTQALQQVLEPLRRTLGWLASLRDGQGRVICPEHRIEHTGKSAYVALLACELARHARDLTERERCVELALQQGRRLVARLEREGSSPCHTFRPGRHDPFNCSNSVIDGGACSDALAHLVLNLAAALPQEDLRAFREAALLHARTYLRYAVLDKGIPAQRAWGLTGLAAAFELARDPDLERAALEAVGVLEGVQHEDGSYPYHPLEWGAGHIGASDVSAFYQSRLSGFLIHALERLGRAPTSALFGGPIQRGLEFLCALQGPDGRKCGLVEAKPWYWGATYEVASHVFDAHALARGWELFGRPRYGAAAARAWRAWVAHLSSDGRPSSHQPGPGRLRSYQCPLFWAAHAAWIARALRPLACALDRFPAGSPTPGARERSSIDLEVSWYPRAQLVRLEDARVVAWVRGARPGFNVNHGSPHGAGLLQVVSKSDGRDLLERCRLGGSQEGEWHGLAGGIAPRRGWNSGGQELRFSLWLARVELRARRPLRALGAAPDLLRRGVLSVAHPRVSSAFALAPELRLLPDGVELTSQLAWRDGTAVSGSRLLRTYQLDGEGVLVRDEILSAGSARGVGYTLPKAARDAKYDAHVVEYRLG
ncbi:MAG: hypothetical protein FJ299_02655 [Planctomycetes bacterium]|nr:hypothetical protein [Planctomycetota bacterium]